MEVPMLIAIASVLVVVAVTSFAPKVGVASPLLLVGLGMAVSLLPFVAAIEIDPEWILDGVLPPLLYATAVNTSVMEFRRDVGLISVYSVLLVVASAVAVGFLLAWLIPGLGLALGIAIGAIVSPTDAVATSIVRRAGVSPRIVTILEGESLLNDATALVLLRSAIAATAASVSLWQVAGDFVYAVVLAVAIGWIVGKLNLLVRSRISQPSSNVAVSLVTPFIAFLPAEHLGASGLVAAVAAGLVTGAGSPRRIDSETRMTERAVWGTVELLLESSVFLLMGLELFALVEDVHADHGSLLTAIGLGAAAATVVILTRTGVVAWSVAALARRLRRQDSHRERLQVLQQQLQQGDAADPEAQRRRNRLQLMIDRRYADLDYLAAERLGPREGVILVAAGMRGAVTLAAAQSLPAGTQHRSLLVLIAFVVAVGTLLVQGGLLGWLADRLGLTGRDDARDPEQSAALWGELTEAVTKELQAGNLRRTDGSAFSADLERLYVDRLAAGSLSLGGFDSRELSELATAVSEVQREALWQARSVGRYSSAVIDSALAKVEARLWGLDSSHPDSG